jgi:signal transduction histidine kinase
VIHNKNRHRAGATSFALVSCAVLLALLLCVASGCGGGPADDIEEAGSSTTEQVVEQFVDEALEYARENGKEKALAEFTDQSGEFKRGELYIYAYDYDGNVLAHGGDPSLVGQDLIDYEDPEGVKVIRGLIEIARDQGAGWLSYTWENPETGEQEPKRGYVVDVDGTWFLGSGTYD